MLLITKNQKDITKKKKKKEKKREITVRNMKVKN